ncbi:protein lin-37 homolog isoform X2 [Atheta coriaria]|uniref:protein lin-37 homolog isoform X2 n=1 Tax=Dalotia coriaria TaxID=877792 RepID=UPI0031F42790
MKMEEKRGRLDSQSPTRVEVKEENVMGNDYLMAKGRFQGVLKLLTEQSSSDSEDSDDRPHHHKTRNDTTPVRSTYLMKLYDRSVDLAKFEEDTPLYPICRAWMANNSKKQHTIVKRRLSSPEPESQWNNNLTSDLYRLPAPSKPFVTRIPTPTPEQLDKDKDAINLNYDENPPMSKQELLSSHLRRWGNIKRKWIMTAAKNEERYAQSRKILRTIYSKAHETMLE